MQRLAEDDGISLTIDCWTTLTMDGYMTVTGHDIGTEWKYLSYVLDTGPVGNLDDNGMMTVGTHRRTGHGGPIIFQIAIFEQKSK